MFCKYNSFFCQFKHFNHVKGLNPFDRETRVTIHLYALAINKLLYEQCDFLKLISINLFYVKS